MSTSMRNSCNQSSVECKRQVGFWTITSLVSGNLIGSGVFMLPVTLAAFGGMSLVGWGATSIGAIFLALVFAKLGATTARSGGPHVYVQQAFGNTSAFYVAWSYWTFSWISNAAVISAAVGYLSILTGGFTVLQTLMIELGIIAVFTSINLFGIQVAGRLELVFTFLKLLPLLIVPLFGVFHVRWENFVPLNPTAHSFSHAFMLVTFLTIWGFIGLETGTVPSGEIKDPNKTIPRATITGTSIATLVYLLGTVAIVGAIPQAMLAKSTAPYADLAHVIFGGNWGGWVALAAVLCTLGTYNGWTLVVSRIAYGAACDGLFPKIFKVENKTGAPKWGILISSICTTVIVLLTLDNGLTEQFNYVVDVSVTIILLMYLLCILAYIKLIVTKERTSGNILIGAGALAFVSLAIWAANTKMLFLSLIILLCGMPMHFYMRRVGVSKQGILCH